MIAYFDASALIPLVIAEAGSPSARRLWDEAQRVVSVRLAYPEARAALAQAHRLGRLSSPDLRGAVDDLDGQWAQLDLVEIDADLAQGAGELAEARELRGYDAVHLAAALQVGSPEVILIAGDRPLLAAARAVGLATAEPS